MTKYFFFNSQIYIDNSMYISTFSQPKKDFRPCVFILISKQPRHTDIDSSEEKRNVKVNQKEK